MKKTELQEKVIASATKKLKHEEWFKGICLDNLPDDLTIQKDFDQAVQKVMMETEYWDRPNGIRFGSN